MARMRETGRYTGPASLEVDDSEIDVTVTLTAWIEVLEEGVDGLATWSGSMSGPGPAPDIVGGPHTLRLRPEASGQVLVTDLNHGSKPGWSARVQGSDSCPF